MKRNKHRVGTCLHQEECKLLLIQASSEADCEYPLDTKKKGGVRLQKGKAFWKGSVRIRVTGCTPERFFNLCGHHNIALWDVTECQGGFEMSLFPEDFFRLPPIRRKSDVRIQIKKKEGLPFFYRKSLRRKAFFIGFFLCAAGLYTLSQFVWNIHVEGNYANSTQTILNSLEAAGIHHGIWKKRVDCSRAAAYLREQFPNLTWVSARMEGTQLVLVVKENIDGYRIRKNAENPQNLVAKKEGTIVRIITRNGIPQVLPGDTCESGEVLVTGEIPLVNDNGDIYAYSYVHADADIDLETTWYYYDIFPLSYTVRIYQNAEARTPVLQIFSYRFFVENPLPDNFIKRLWSQNRMQEPATEEGGEGADEEISVRQFYLTENFALPLYFGYRQQFPFKVWNATYTEREAKEKSSQNFQKFRKKLLEKGLQISENHVTIEVNDTSCITKGTLRVVEQAVEAQPCKMQKVSDGKESMVDEQQ